MVFLSILAALLYAAGAIWFYKRMTKQLTPDRFERIWYSLVWPAILPLWLIYYLYNRHW